jgi:sugar lactone lactonase YvrE
VPHAEQFTDPVAYHGEGPLWAGGLHYVDMLAGDVLSVRADGTVDRRHVGRIAAALRPRAGGGFVYGVERGFALDDGPGTPVVAMPEVWSDSGVRMNDGGCDPAGNFLCGSMAYDQHPGAGALYRLAPDGTVTTALGDVTISNGLDWSPDGSLAYYNDTATHAVSVFDWDPDRGLTDRRVFVDCGDASPDGLTVDAEGGIWTALYGGSAVHRYDPSGRLAEVVELPVTNVSACTFGGQDWQELFITTSREGVDPDEQPQAGAVFRYVPGVRGRPPRTFAG